MSRSSREQRRSLWSRIRSFGQPRRASPIDVTYLHELLLERAPRRGELSAYDGEDLISVVSELARSWEHREVMRAALPSDVARLYRGLLRREPESDEVVSARVGRPLLDLVMEFAQTDEFRGRVNGATESDVYALYARLLNRKPENESVVKARIGLPLLDVAIEIAQSREALTRQDLPLEELQAWCAAVLGAPLEAEWARQVLDVIRDYRLPRVALIDHLVQMRLRRLGLAQADGPLPREREVDISEADPLHYAPSRHAGTDITLVVPTIDSEPWIQAVIDFYDTIGWRPLYAVDSRTQDATRAVLDRAAQTWIEVSADAPRVEALMPEIVKRISTPWVLRLDDDELPSPGLLKFCEAAIARSAPVWGFPRLAVRWDAGRAALDYSRFLSVGPHAHLDRQWRMFRPDSVVLHTRVHTAGFDTPLKAPAPEAAFLVHFDWVLRTESQRRDKLGRYAEQVDPTVPSPPVMPPYEAIPEEWHLFQPLELPQFVEFARRVYRAGRRRETTSADDRSGRPADV